MPAVESKRTIREVWIFTSPKAGTGAGRGEILRLIELCRAEGMVCRRIDNLAELAERVG
ncbi:MAG: protein BmrU, partial [Rhodopirellula bahusiensis]